MTRHGQNIEPAVAGQKLLLGGGGGGGKSVVCPSPSPTAEPFLLQLPPCAQAALQHLSATATAVSRQLSRLTVAMQRGCRAA